MRKWEYCTRYISQQPAEEARSMQMLEKMGAEGWEMMHCREDGYRLLKAIFKREILQNDEGQD